jgi:hypothetical protein
MAMTGLVTAFPLLLVTQMLWGVGWGVLERRRRGVDHRRAWSARPDCASAHGAGPLGCRGRGSGDGRIRGLGWAAGLTTAIVASGAAMALLGLYLAARFTEDNFTPVREQRWNASLSIFRRGAALARRDHEILLVLAATMLINAASMVTWLFPRQLIDRGFPNDPVLWYAALGIVSFAVGAVALRIVEAHIDRAPVARRAYAFACFVGAGGLIVLACAPDALIGCIGVLLVSGLSLNVTPGGQRDLGEPAHDQRGASDRALVPLPGRVRR